MKLRQLPRWIYLYLTGWKNQLFPDMDWDAFRSAPGMVGYVVQEKETLWDIAKKFFTTVEAIMEVNQKETEQVQTGDMILILKEVS